MGMGAPAGGGGGDYGSGGDEYGGGMSDPFGSGGYGSGGYGSGGPMAKSPDSPYDGTVELYGIVYIYNPVDANKLGLKETAAATGEPLEASDPATAPATETDDTGTGQPAEDPAAGDTPVTAGDTTGPAAG
jgi:hypothetical protein